MLACTVHKLSLATREFDYSRTVGLPGAGERPALCA